MKVLFFLEPFPVRGRPLDFLWVFENWARLASTLVERGFEIEFAVSDAVKEARAYTQWKLWAPQDFGVPPLQSVGAERDAEWVQLMRDPQFAPWRSFCERLLGRVRPAVVVSWTVNAPLKAVAEASGTLVLHQEQGLVRLPEGAMYFCDPTGVNGASSLPAIWDSVRKCPLTNTEDAALTRFVSEFLSPPADRARAFLSEQGGADDSRKVLGVFLQVPNDSNLLTWSTIEGNQGLLRRVAEAADPSRYRIVVKQHPFDPTELTLPSANMVRAPRDLPSLELIQAVDAVFVINSSVGFEALAHRKPTFAFGRSPYGGLGVTVDVGGDAARLREALQALHAPTPDEEAERRRLLHFLVFRYLVTDGEMWDPDALASRLLAWKALAAQGPVQAEWFQPALDATRLRELRTAREMFQLRRDLDGVREALETQKTATSALETARAGLEAQLGERTAELAQERTVVAGLNERLASLTADLEATNAALKASRDALAQTEARLRQAEQERAEAQHALQLLHASAGMRTVEWARSLPGVMSTYQQLKKARSELRVELHLTRVNARGAWQRLESKIKEVRSSLLDSPQE